uniref:Uncharacterized protein n=1 Tax=Rhizophora mucronata TaxID=61149 RepID=A0A2P2M7Q4_RHIMU
MVILVAVVLLMVKVMLDFFRFIRGLWMLTNLLLTRMMVLTAVVFQVSAFSHSTAIQYSTSKLNIFLCYSYE